MSAKKDQEAPADGGAKKSDGGAKKGDGGAKKGDGGAKKGDGGAKKGDGGAKKSKPAAAETKASKKVPTPRLMERYFKEIVPALLTKFGRNNILSLPRMRKIVINMGVGRAITEKKFIEEAVEAMKTIAGQKPVVTRARLSVAGFKLREGQAVGCKVTLRGKRMYEFLDRLVSLALPRVRDFRGLNPEGFDGNGNYSLGLTEQLVFPELNPDKYTNVQGMHVTLVTNCGNDGESRELLRAMGVPLRQA
jgi:large subunit ribosomal protein L5